MKATDETVQGLLLPAEGNGVDDGAPSLFDRRPFSSSIQLQHGMVAKEHRFPDKVTPGQGFPCLRRNCAIPTRDKGNEGALELYSLSRR